MAIDQFKKMGFTAAKDMKTKPRIILSISALEKCGKTHFGLSAPGPIAMFNTDTGEEGVIEKFPNKNIQIMSIDRVDENSADQAPKEFKRFKEAYMDVLRGNYARTILIDTATEIWEILRMARFGKLTQVMPYQYGPVNAEYRALIRDAYNYDKNVILLHKMKAQYINDKRTGEYERAGFSDTGFLVQVNAQMYRYAPEDGGDFAMFIRDCRQTPEIAGEELVGPLCSFPFLASMVIPSVDPSEWE
jgi:hypothetical protein